MASDNYELSKAALDLPKEDNFKKKYYYYYADRIINTKNVITKKNGNYHTLA